MCSDTVTVRNNITCIMPAEESELLFRCSLSYSYPTSNVDLCFSVLAEIDSCYATQGGRSSSCSGRYCGRIEEDDAIVADT